MAYKILTKNGIDNSNIDGARGEYFNSGMRDGIVQGVLNEGLFTATASNIISLDTCELRIAGHRIVIDEPVYHTFTNAPSTDTRYAFVAQIIVDDNQNVDFSLFVQTASTPLIQNNLYKNITGAGTYQVEIGRFTLLTDGTITDVVRTIDVITGADGVDGDYIRIGEVTTTMLETGLDAEVDIENVINESTGLKETNFNFSIPKSAGSVINVNGEQVESVNFNSDPQTQINQLSNPNLLINGDFRVNQRNFTSIEATSSSDIKNAYTVDRWVFTSTTTRFGKLEVNSNGGLDFTCYSQAISIKNVLEMNDTNKLKGKTLTATIKISNIVGNSPLMISIREKNTWRTFATNRHITTPGTYSITGQIPTDVTNELLVYISFEDEFVDQTTVSIDWVKLEEGEISTPFIQRPYAEELALCQRYYVKYNNNLYIRGITVTTTQARGYIPLLQTLRTVPTVTIANITSGNIVYEGNIIPISNYAYYISDACQITVTFTSSQNISSQRVCSISTGGSVELDAEIY